MDEEIRGLLLEAYTSISDNKAEKEDLLCQMIRITNLLNIYFSANRNLIDAISYFQEIICYYVKESELEYKFYDKAIKYLESILKSDDIDVEIIEGIASAFDFLDELFTTRTLNTIDVIKYFDMIISYKVLSNNNYFVNSYVDRINDEEMEKLLQIIPKI